MAATDKADPRLVTTCAKCGRRLPHPDLPGALCPKCDLIDALLVERYSTHERTPDNG